MEYVGRVWVGWPDGTWHDLGECRADDEETLVDECGDPVDPLHEAAMEMMYRYVEALIASGQAPDRADFLLKYHYWPFYQLN